MRNDSTALSCFLSISRAIAGQMDYEAVLKNFATELEQLIPHDHLDIVLRREDGNQVCYEATLLTTWSNLANPVKPTSTSPIRSVLLGEAPYILTEDAWDDIRFHFEGADDQPIFDANLRSRVIVPLLACGEVIGSLAVSSHEVGRYTEDIVAVVQSAGDLIGPYFLALQRGREAQRSAVAESEARAREKVLRVGAQRLTEGMEQERQRLGMDLHDQTVADLARLSRRIARLRRDPTVTSDDLLGVEEEVHTCLIELRTIVEDMKPGVLQLFGFAEAVDAHLRRGVADRTPAIDVAVTDRTEGLVDDLPETVRIALYRIVQEAINNALKHGAPTTISVTVTQDSDDLKIAVEDDGTGIPPGALASTNGIGHIRTRAALISASAVFERPHGSPGTVVSVTLPLSTCARSARTPEPA